MVRALLLGLATLTIGCADHRYSQPIPTGNNGSAVRANMAAQIIDPTPPTGAAPATDAARAALGITAYRTDEVKKPKEQSASGGVGASE